MGRNLVTYVKIGHGRDDFAAGKIKQSKRRCTSHRERGGAWNWGGAFTNVVINREEHCEKAELRQAILKQPVGVRAREEMENGEESRDYLIGAGARELLHRINGICLGINRECGWNSWTEVDDDLVGSQVGPSLSERRGGWAGVLNRFSIRRLWVDRTNSGLNQGHGSYMSFGQIGRRCLFPISFDFLFFYLLFESEILTKIDSKLLRKNWENTIGFLI